MVHHGSSSDFCSDFCEFGLIWRIGSPFFLGNSKKSSAQRLTLIPKPVPRYTTCTPQGSLGLHEDIWYILVFTNQGPQLHQSGYLVSGRVFFCRFGGWMILAWPGKPKKPKPLTTIFQITTHHHPPHFLIVTLWTWQPINTPPHFLGWFPRFPNKWSKISKGSASAAKITNSAVPRFSVLVASFAPFFSCL